MNVVDNLNSVYFLGPPSTVIANNTHWPRIRGCWQPSGKCVLFKKAANILEKFVRGWPIASDTLEKICQRVANTLLTSATNLPQGCQQPMVHLWLPLVG